MLLPAQSGKAKDKQFGTVTSPGYLSGSNPKLVNEAVGRGAVLRTR
jgi:hypothetical protein